MTDDTQPIFLKIKGGWINPLAILSVETHRDNDAMLNLRVTGYERPIPLNEADSAYIAKYLESRTWQPAKEESGGGSAIPLYRSALPDHAVGLEPTNSPSIQEDSR